MEFDTGKRLDLPQWTTANRPSNPPAGTIGFNTTREVAETYNGSFWSDVGKAVYPDPIANGLTMHFDANRPNELGYVGTTWIDHASGAGNVNLRNRNNGWSFQTESTTNLICAYNNTNTTSGSGCNVPIGPWWNKMEGTFELWLRATETGTGPGWFVNSDGDYTNQSNWFWFGAYSNSWYFRQGNSSSCCNDVSTGSWNTNYQPANTWACFVVSWKVSAARGTVYKNGSQILQRTNLPTDIPNSNPTGTAQIFNGHSRSDNEQYKGYCSMYRYWNRELTSTEIATMYDRYKGLHGL